MNVNILIIDDDVDLCTLLKKYLKKNNFNVDTAFSGQSALERLQEEKYEIIFCDYRLGDKDGLEVLQLIKQKHPETEVIMMTAYSDIQVAVKLIKSGAYDYICKPLVPEELLHLIQKALENHQGKLENPTHPHSSEKSIPKKNSFFQGESSSIKELYKQVDLVAPTDYNVILHGESGSGKEVIAKMIHDKSHRSSKPFVALDCGTLSRELANSELFGHIKGSFTGAISDKKGHFELANGGTLFLDEIANLSYEVQAALLRVIQERKMKRIGSTKTIKLDVRIIVASHENLRFAYEQQSFREDLYHRLNEFYMKVPSLKERKDDIPGFATYFLKLSNTETGKQIKGFEDEVIETFLNYSWPGNIRELRNVIRRAVLLTSSNKVNKEALSPELLQTSREMHDFEKPLNNFELRKGDSLKAVGQEAEYQIIMKVLEAVEFNKSKAAKILNIDRKTLYNKMKVYKDS